MLSTSGRRVLLSDVLRRFSGDVLHFLDGLVRRFLRTLDELLRASPMNWFSDSVSGIESPTAAPAISAAAPSRSGFRSSIASGYARACVENSAHLLLSSLNDSPATFWARSAASETVSLARSNEPDN